MRDSGSDDDTNGNERLQQDDWHIQLFQVRFTTQRLNAMFARWANFSPTFWNWWFSIGVVVGGLTMVAGILVMFVAAFKIMALFGQALFTATSSPATPNNQLQRWTKRDLEPEQTADKQNEQLFLPMVRMIDTHSQALTGPIDHFLFRFPG